MRCCTLVSINKFISHWMLTCWFRIPKIAQEYCIRESGHPRGHQRNLVRKQVRRGDWIQLLFQRWYTYCYHCSRSSYGKLLYSCTVFFIHDDAIVETYLDWKLSRQVGRRWTLGHCLHGCWLQEKLRGSSQDIGGICESHKGCQDFAKASSQTPSECTVCHSNASVWPSQTRANAYY